MSFRPGQELPIPTSEEEMQGFYEPIGPPVWPGVDAPTFQTAFMDANHQYCTDPMVHPNILTPISLPDSSFRPSPAVNHQEYHPQESYYINDPIAQPQGLGISAPFPSEYPRTSVPSSINYAYAPGDLQQYGLGSTPSMSPQAPQPKRMKRTSSKTPSRDTPINILPHPEGMQRMERDRQNNQPSPPIMPPRTRAPGRGRRDPQAEEEDAFVERLREEQSVPWKDICDMFFERFGKQVTPARLQMRLGRRKSNRKARWDDADVSTLTRNAASKDLMQLVLISGCLAQLQLLTRAHESWEQEKYRFIADKMKELGCTKDYTPEQCKSQLRIQFMGDLERGSPSAKSDPAPSPKTSNLRKRRRQSREA
ncbi:hypothetical protein N7532_003823 [Penicillium argentinense]|uniref:Uncharacterized protein n=1 Tax=Penicillium argentinense TaxID=1131581 RepID=A0A9W9FNA6_9EURO|nr:uncharacterized protein N7532_003823 [Penicillium argentinense]KAJ5103294.1 hypothetical protein N7532_003823 [Penicillium argentinense]